MNTPTHFDQTLAYCVNFAVEALKQNGGFYPFGCVVDLSGQLGAVGATTGKDHPNTADLYQMLKGALHSLARDRKIVAAAIAIDVNVPLELKTIWTDGIRVDFENDELSYRTYVPYQLTQELVEADRNVSLADPITVPSTHEFFQSR